MSTEEEKEFEKKMEQKVEGWCSRKDKKGAYSSGSGGLVWCLGLIGAAVYYIQTASGFWDGVLGVLKAIVWPAFLVYEAMKALGM